MNPHAIIVELFANSLKGAAIERHCMTRSEKPLDDKNTFIYSVEIPTGRPTSDYTARAVASQEFCKSTALELPEILWQR